MIKTYLLLLTACLCVPGANAQGTYAGSMKKLIGTTFQDAKSIADLKTFNLREANLISAIDDPESIVVDHFQKGTTAVIVFSILESQDDKDYTILDVLEFRNIPAGWEMKTAFCRQNEIENVEIVALVKSGKEEFLKPAKTVWMFNRGKRKIQAMDKAGIDCIGAPGD